MEYKNCVSHLPYQAKRFRYSAIAETGDTLEKVKGKKIKVIIFVDQTVVVFSESHNTPPKASA